MAPESMPCQTSPGIPSWAHAPAQTLCFASEASALSTTPGFGEQTAQLPDQQQRKLIPTEEKLLIKDEKQELGPKSFLSATKAGTAVSEFVP